MSDSGSGKLQRLQDEVASLIDEDAVATAEPRLTPAHRFVHFWIMVGRNFIRNRCPVRASALAYTTLLALVPLLAVSISVASLFLPSEEAEQKKQLLQLIDSSISNIAPALGLGESATTDGGTRAPDRAAARTKRLELAQKVVQFVSNIRFGTIGATAMAGLLFVAISLLRTVEAALNDIWGVPRGRSWFMSIVLYWTVITLGPVVVLMAKGANYLHVLPQIEHSGTTAGSSGASETPAMTSSTRNVPGDVSTPAAPAEPVFHLFGLRFSANWMQKTFLGHLITSCSWMLSVGLMGAAFASLYLWMPNTRVTWQAAAVGGLVASGLWTLNGHLAALYNSRVVTYNAIYGSLGIIPLFLVGMYFSWLILLFGAQTTYVFQHRRAYLLERRAGRVHQQGREFIAVRFCTHLAVRFREGQPPLTASQLADHFGVPPKLARELLQNLVTGHVLMEAAGPETTYAPARPPARISLMEVLAALRSGTGEDFPTTADPSRPVVRAEVEAIWKADAERAATVTLEDLARRSNEADAAGASPKIEATTAPATV
jgi:membrane protein